MRKILLFLLTIVALSSYAQLQKTATFDFSDPANLTPAQPVQVTTSVRNVTFTDNDASLWFTVDPSQPQAFSATLYYITPSGSNPYYSLTFGTYVQMHIAVPNDCYITKIEMDGGHIGLLSDVGGYGNKTWLASDNSTSEVSFSVSGSSSPNINYIKVYYSAPSAIMNYSSASITDKTGSHSYSDDMEVESFNSLDITFSSNISAKNLSAITMVDKNNQAVAITSSCSGSVLTIAANTAITEDNDYTISVPASVVKSGNYENKAFDFTFKVRKERETFNYSKVVPDQG